MELTYNEKNGYSYFTIDNCLTDDQIDQLRDIFNFIKPNLKTPDGTGTARDEDGKPLKDNKAYFLYDLNPLPPFVDSLSVNFFDTLKEATHLSSKDSVYAGAVHTNWSQILLSYYENKSSYKPHQDVSLITCLMWFDLYEKNYTGGELYLPEVDVSFEPKHNTGIIMPSHYLHEVRPVEIIDTDKQNGGRLALSIFCGTGNK